MKLLLEAPTNNRKSRYRPKNTQKYAAVLLISDQAKRDFAEEVNEFGNIWARKYKPEEIKKVGGDQYVWKIFPSINEVLEGLMLWYARQMEVVLKETKGKNERLRSVKNNREIFIEIFNLMDFTEAEKDTPMKGDYNTGYDPILGLLNPYSKASCLLMQLYSMEIGSPQLYAEANRVAR